MCDFARYYHIYSGEGFSISYLATLAYNLPAESLTKMKVMNVSQPINTIILAMAVDRLNLLIWQNTKDGQKNRNRPPKLAETLINKNERKKQELICFENKDNFNAAFLRITKAAKSIEEG